MLKDMIASKESKIAELRSALVNGETAEIRSEINATISAIEEEVRQLKEVEAPEVRMNVASAMATAHVATDSAEERAKNFAKTGAASLETRSVLVSSGNIATPTGVAGINDAPVAVSSIVDMVKVTDAEGMGAYKVAYIESYGAAGEQTEGAAYNAADPVFKTVTIMPETQSILSYVSRQVQKQSPLNYSQKVNEAALTSLRVAAGKVITDSILASALVDTVDITGALDEKSLRKIALTYGGDNAVEGNAVLFLNKADLIALGDVRGDDLKAVYEILPSMNPNVGTIKDGGLSVSYCINNNLSAGTLVYGNPMNCELALFSNYDIRVSEDFAFDKGLLAIRGDVELGADVVAKGGFVKAVVA